MENDNVAKLKPSVTDKVVSLVRDNPEVLEEEKVAEVLKVFKSFNFHSMARDKKVVFIESMYGVFVTEEETEKKEVWLAQLILVREEMNKPCPKCYGAGCAKCYQTGRKRIE